MDNFEKTIYPINPVPYEYGFRLYKIDNYYIRLVTRTDVYDLYLDENFDIKYKSINQKFNGYNSYWNLFSYHNNIVIIYNR